ncbi:MAG: hypothetical protein GX766_10845 [Firmicutes bacterium]|nr:hypothetical protein [Bacillota bacterium]
MAEVKAVTQQIYDPGQLPLVLKTQDIMNLCRCSRPSALDIIRKAEKQGILVLWVGNQPRVNRDVFIDWLQSRKPRKAI